MNIMRKIELSSNLLSILISSILICMKLFDKINIRSKFLSSLVIVYAVAAIILIITTKKFKYTLSCNFCKIQLSYSCIVACILSILLVKSTILIKLLFCIMFFLLTLLILRKTKFTNSNTYALYVDSMFIQMIGFNVIFFILR